MKTFSINPATEEIISEWEYEDKKTVLEKIDRIKEEFAKWSKTSFKERAERFLNLANDLRKNASDYALLITNEMGKPIKQSITEVQKCALVCEYYAENGENFLKNEVVETEAFESYVEFDPLGLVLAIMPWNFPFWQVFRCAVPSIMAGNVVMLKHSPNVFGCAVKIKEIFSRYFPPVFEVALIDTRIAEEIIPHFNAVSITGSTQAGSKVAEVAGKNLVKQVMELGGSDPFIVLEDADISRTAQIAVQARMVNNGQSCIAPKRFIINKKIYKEFTERVVELAKKISVGNPLEEKNDIGPLAREDILNNALRIIQDSNGKILLGGTRIGSKGYFLQPTIIADSSTNSAVFCEETFAPIMPIISVQDDETAILLANKSEFGLGASIWTQNIQKAKMLAKEIQSGLVFINGMVRSDPRLPFGGVKKSGYGRELSHYGIKEFVNIKTIWIER